MTRNALIGLGLSTLMSLSLAVGAHAQSFSLPATDDSKVLADDTANGGHAGGPDTAPYTITIEGPQSNGNNASGTKYDSFVPMDFVFAAPAKSISSASGLTLALADQASSFEGAGTLNFYLASNTTVSIDNPTSPLVYDPTVTTNPAGVGSQMGTYYQLGSIAYTPQITRGAVVTFSLALANAAAVSQFTKEVNSGDVRLFMTADTSTPAIAANFYGYNSTSATATIKPTLSFTGAPAAAPEPGGVAAILIGVGMVGLIAVRRRFDAH